MNKIPNLMNCVGDFKGSLGLQVVLCLLLVENSFNAYDQKPISEYLRRLFGLLAKTARVRESKGSSFGNTHMK